MITLEFLRKVKNYIEESEVLADEVAGGSRELDVLIKMKAMPKLYYEVVFLIKKIEDK